MEVMVKNHYGIILMGIFIAIVLTAFVAFKYGDSEENSLQGVYVLSSEAEDLLRI